ncbi:glycoside hydrolase family 3 C-terminal domain-containing protein [Streptomyces sp. TRM 70351]|uniref:glycoside hydrolase family 3 C-terminal domain-containing protein n=1 Tax=Streptomyces sp. TRM 70351 TaxID=3116552 RepID=UPI002E7B373F|nr:glycoside hydrolase family 3 C-terminal domain-containing protein [Streptomyces sp. TRM 70351]MEE1931105.1 glycoside hydrolase family 3 C-terminal domain-containing protein [Streptomyces sp. TRM 70351]
MPTDQPPFRDPALPVAERADDLLHRLTPDEKLAMLHQFAPPVERLGLGAFTTGQEALHGVAWRGPATVFPQAVGLGATWDEELVRQVGEAVSTEVRAMRGDDPRIGLNVWSPTVNLLSHPLWGRNEEGYAEDACLTGALATAYTRGLRGDDPVYWRTAPVLKHWLAHRHEEARDTASTSVPARVLHEYELPAFRGAVEAGAVAGVMPAYNLVNGRPNHLSPLLNAQLRAWTAAELVVCSDAGAPTNIAGSQAYHPGHDEGLAAALRAGVDSFTDHGEDSAVTLGRLRRALERGLITTDDVDTAVRRLLRMRIALGELDPAHDPYAGIDRAGGFDTPAHRALALTTAERAVVLLKNDGLLPLRSPARVAVVGPLADACKLDWYSGELLHRVTPLDGLLDRLGAGAVTFAEGADRVRLRCADGYVQVPEAGPEADRDAPHDDGAEPLFDPALRAGRTDLPPLTVGPRPTEFALLDWGDGVLTLRAPDGRHLSVAEDGYVRASAPEPGGWVVNETFRLEPHDGAHVLVHLGSRSRVGLSGGKLKTSAEDVPFALEVVEDGARAVAHAAAGADVVIVVAGNDPHINGRETEDRRTLALPAQQERLWRAAREANPRTALVLVSSYPYAVGEAHDRLPALLWTAHGGQAAGTALARVLCGDVCPSGRLPQTWYARDADLPEPTDYDIIGSRSTYLYFDGTPLYPFGHGLSYAEFSHTGLTAAQRGDTVEVRCTVAHAAGMPGAEVVQLYARAADAAVPRPHRALVAHRRVELSGGEHTELVFRVPLSALGHYDVVRGRWTVPGGRYEFHVGASSTDIRAVTALRVDGEDPVRRNPGDLPAAAFDAQTGTELVDLTRENGDAVTPRGTGPGHLVFSACDFGARGPLTATVEAALDGDAEARVELRLADGTELASVAVRPTGDRYAYATRTAVLAHRPTGVHDVHVTLRGPARLARLHLI